MQNIIVLMERSEPRSITSVNASLYLLQNKSHMICGISISVWNGKKAWSMNSKYFLLVLLDHFYSVHKIFQKDLVQSLEDWLSTKEKLQGRQLIANMHLSDPNIFEKVTIPSWRFILKCIYFYANTPDFIIGQAIFFQFG